MKQRLKKNGIILISAIGISILLTFVTNGFAWSFRIFSDMLTYTGVSVMTYGAYVASNMSNMFSGLKKDMNTRYSPEEKAEKNRIVKVKLTDGWMMLATGTIVVALSVIVVRF